MASRSLSSYGTLLFLQYTLTTVYYAFVFLLPSSGRVDRSSATETVDTGLIPSRVKLKTIKIGIYNFPA